VLQEICHGAIQRFNTKAALKQIASATWALMQTPEIKTDIKLVDVYNSAFFSKHFEWMQRSDLEIGNKPGFLSRHLGVQYYLMMTELDSWYNIDTNGKEVWKSIEAFAKYRLSIAQLPAREVPTCSRSQGQHNKSKSNKKRRRIFF
jgi:hypothetical protein